MDLNKKNSSWSCVKTHRQFRVHQGYDDFHFEPSFLIPEDPIYETIYETKWKLLTMEAARLQRESSGTWKPLSNSSRESSLGPGITSIFPSSNSLTHYSVTSSPRQLILKRLDNSFGFTLRHFIVYPPEDSETYEDLNSLKEPLDTIFVKSVKEGGSAALSGLKTGDRIINVNGESIAGKSYSEVIKLIQKSEEYLRLTVCPQQDDVLQMYFSEIAQNPESNTRVQEPLYASISSPSQSISVSDPSTSLSYGLRNSFSESDKRKRASLLSQQQEIVIEPNIPEVSIPSSASSMEWKSDERKVRPNTLELHPILDDLNTTIKQSHKFAHSDNRRGRRISYYKATKDVESEDEEDYKNCSSTDGPELKDSLSGQHIQKLRSFFGEKSGDESVVNSSPTSDSVIKEGWLNCKVNSIDGKRASDRSWKPVYVILKSHAMFMYRDKKIAHEHPLSCEEIPVSLSESSVEIADDYTKRKNVFRIKTDTGSIYLFQAEEENCMIQWVKSVQETTMAIIVDERKDFLKKKKNNSSLRSPEKVKGPRKVGLDPLVCTNNHKKTWKGKVAQKWKKIHGIRFPEGGSIGVPLEDCPLSFDNIPLLIQVCTRIVEAKGLEVIGIYRVPGNNAALSNLTESVNQINGEEFLLRQDDPKWEDINVVSSLLKLFFRKLPDPLFTIELYSSFIDASKTEEPTIRLLKLKRLLKDLPEIHYQTLKHVIYHLQRVLSHSEINKMESRNLAIVFGPTLIRTSDDNMLDMIANMSHQCRIIESILSHVDWFFSDFDEEEIREDEVNFPALPVELTLTENGNEHLLLTNLQKLEESGKIHLSSSSSPISAKDIVSGIISAANRKMKQNKMKNKGSSSSVPFVSPKGFEETNHELMVSQVERDVSIESPPLTPPIKVCSSSQFPIESYSGLQEAQAERIRRFEEETKAMLCMRSSASGSSSRPLFDTTRKSDEDLDTKDESSKTTTTVNSNGDSSQGRLLLIPNRGEPLTEVSGNLKRRKWTDSNQGSDAISNVSANFDEKLRLLLNPSYSSSKSPSEPSAKQSYKQVCLREPRCVTIHRTDSIKQKIKDSSTKMIGGANVKKLREKFEPRKKVNKYSNGVKKIKRRHTLTGANDWKEEKENYRRNSLRQINNFEFRRYSLPDFSPNSTTTTTTTLSLYPNPIPTNLLQTSLHSKI